MQLALQKESSIDELTGLANRRGFLMLAEQHALLARRTGETFLVGFIDLNGLKHINDTLGHQGGDAAIVEAAQVLKTCCRQSDILGRLGGDEFAFLLPVSPDETRESIRERFRQELQLRNAEAGRGFRLSFSMGIVAADGAQELTMEELLAQADALMYEEKQANDTGVRRV
jgi:diguanylate cyclase (GGDEF)-like protein